MGSPEWVLNFGAELFEGLVKTLTGVPSKHSANTNGRWPYLRTVKLDFLPDLPVIVISAARLELLSRPICIDVDGSDCQLLKVCLFCSLFYALGRVTYPLCRLGLFVFACAILVRPFHIDIMLSSRLTSGRQRPLLKMVLCCDKDMKAWN